ncbi:hypothetical protein [Kordiimonas sp.]|uniref:hypothetical protein n=1 Tax=Kordiimonas sp. TaxID=1970157 RepID=UPI003A8CA48E
MTRLLFLLCALWSTELYAQDTHAYLKWNIDHTQRIPRPAYPLTPQQSKSIDHYVLSHDARGRLTRVTFMHSGKPSPAGDYGAATLTLTYENDKTVEAYLNTEGEPVAAGGILRKIYHHDNTAFWHRLSFETTDGTGVTPSGYSEVRVERDNEGRVITETRFSRDGEIVPEHNGFAVASFAYDANDMALYRQYENAEGKLLNGSLGYARVSFSFDEFGNFLSEEAQDASGKLTAMSAGFSRIEWRDFNSFGKPARVYYFDAQARPYAPYAYSSRSYTEAMQRDGVAYYGAEGQPAMHPAGFHRIEYHYKENGSLAERKLFDASETLITNR